MKITNRWLDYKIVRWLGRGLFYLSIYLSICLFLSTCLHSGVGTTSGSALKIGVGAKPLGMAGAVSSLTDDTNSLYWNPAGLSHLKRYEVSVMHIEWFEGIRYEYFAGGIPTRFGNFGIGLAYLSMGDIPKITKKKEILGSFSSYDLIGTVGYGRSFGELISLGINIKGINEKIDDLSATAFACDIGTIIKIKKPKGISFGFTIQNFGTMMKFYKQKFHLPLSISGGVGYKNNKVSVGLDVKSQPRDRRALISFGGEYAPLEILFLRGGYSFSTKSDKLGGVSGISCGIGFSVQSFKIDYAFVPYGDLGTTHRISASFSFGKSKTRKEKKGTGPISKPKEKLQPTGIEIVKPTSVQSDVVAEQSSADSQSTQLLNDKKKMMEEYFNKATEFYKDEKYEEAIKKWEKVLEIDPSHELSKEKIQRAKEQLQNISPR